MSKSYDNYIAIDDSPEDMYGKIMSINDSMILKYYKLAVFADRDRIESVKLLLEDNSNNPRDIKRSLAKDLVARYYSEEKAKLAEAAFDQIFVKKDNPDNMPSYNLSSEINLVDILLSEKLIVSKGEGKRLINQNAVKVDGKVCDDINQTISPSDEDIIVKVGKRRFLRIVS
jgi:tyrosyl-tRNA synthetase